MATQFEFVCLGCSGLTFLATTRFPNACPMGHTSGFNRRYSFAVHRQWGETHFNPTVGKVVSNQAQFVDELKRASDAASEELGMEHRFVPMDPRDRDATRVTEEDPAPPPSRRARGEAAWAEGPVTPPEE